MNNYFYIDAKGQQCGPVSGEELKNCGLTRRTLVWREGMEAWAAADTVAELQPLFVGEPPVPPAPLQPQTTQPSHTDSFAHEQDNLKRRHLLSLAPSNNLVSSILSMLFCCLPFGVVAVVHASRVDGFWARGMRVEAVRESEAARKWCWASVVIGILYQICVLALLISSNI